MKYKEKDFNGRNGYTARTLIMLAIANELAETNRLLAVIADVKCDEYNDSLKEKEADI